MPRAECLTPIPAGCVGDVICQIVHPTQGLRITTVQFGDVYADLGDTVWEPILDELEEP